MRRLRTNDGGAPHRRAARYHTAKCRAGKTPLHAALRDEITIKYKQLKDKAREVEDAEDDYIEAVADSESAELALENVIRNTDGDLARLDRENPALNAQKTVFPEGFGVVIYPEGEKQLGELPALKIRLSAFKDHPLIEDALKKLDEAEDVLRKAFLAEDTASTTVDKLFAEEQEARRGVREQLDSAYGRLRDFHKARPGTADQYFFNESKSRRSKPKSSTGDTPTKPSPAPANPPVKTPTALASAPVKAPTALTSAPVKAPPAPIKAPSVLGGASQPTKPA